MDDTDDNRRSMGRYVLGKREKEDKRVKERERKKRKRRNARERATARESEQRAILWSDRGLTSPTLSSGTKKQEAETDAGICLITYFFICRQGQEPIRIAVCPAIYTIEHPASSSFNSR